MLRIDPQQRHPLAEIIDNLQARIEEATLRVPKIPSTACDLQVLENS